MIKILYVYDLENYALHNVGKLWLEGLDNCIVDFKCVFNTGVNDFRNYDYIWFGCTSLYNTFKYDLSRSIITIHDPDNLFKSVEGWKLDYKSNLNNLHNLRLLRSAGHVITASNEMQHILKELLINSECIPTCSILPKRDPFNISLTDKLNIFTTISTRPRKNIQLAERLSDYCNNILKCNYTLKVGATKILPQSEYIDILDHNNIYVCTSIQEGGPLPAMDAMNRGLVIISSEVGQMPELIQNGYNGFLCKKYEDYIRNIIYLKNNPDKLYQMQLNSLESITRLRKTNDIKLKVKSYISSL